MGGGAPPNATCLFFGEDLALSSSRPFSADGWVERFRAGAP
jgi:hypothetical protein